MMKEGLTFNYPVISPTCSLPSTTAVRRQITRYLQMQSISVVPSTAVVTGYLSTELMSLWT